MAFYESTFIARPDLTAKQAEEIAERYAGIIAGQGGTVAKTEAWGLRGLAYRIKKHRKGHYVLLAIDAPSAAVKEMERNLRIDEDIIRYLTVRVEELESAPSAILTHRGREEGRGRGRDGERGGRGGERFVRDEDADGETASSGSSGDNE